MLAYELALCGAAKTGKARTGTLSITPLWMETNRSPMSKKLLSRSVVTVLLTASALNAGSARGAAGVPAGDHPQACQTAVLRNGYRLPYARREEAGAITRLWVCADAGAGYVEFPSEQIERFEQDESTVAAEPTASAATTTGGRSPAERSFKEVIASAASRHQIDPDFVTSVVKAESGFNPQVISSKGAQGLMQLMPQTAASLGIGNAFDPAANVEGGTKYLRQLLDQYHGNAADALAAYNAGPQRVEYYGGIPPYRETRDFVTRVINDYNRRKTKPAAKPPADNK